MSIICCFRLVVASSQLTPLSAGISYSHLKRVGDLTPPKHLVMPLVKPFPGQHSAAILNSSSLRTAIFSSFPQRREERIHQLRLVLQQLLENKLRPHQSLVSASSFSRENCLWPTSSSRKQLQCFPDFANFLQDCCKVISPPTSLTSPLKPGLRRSRQHSDV